MSENQEAQGSELSERLGRFGIQDLIFTAWHDRHQDTWKAKAERRGKTIPETFATGVGDSANEATEDCVITASIRLNRAEAT